MAHKFDAKNAGVLDSLERVEFLNPANILDKAGISREMVVADLGCGTGFLSIPASFRAKKVFALDVQQAMLDILREKAGKEKITNIETVLSNESLIPLSDNSIDVMLMVNVFHELEDRNSILNEAKRILSDEGKLVIVDWEKMEMDFGPPVEERLAAEEVILACQNNGFGLHERSEAGPYNYLLVFTKEKKRP